MAAPAPAPAAAAAVHVDPAASTIGKASAASTIGTCLERKRLLRKLKAWLLRSPRQFRGKPVTVISFHGLSGAGKSIVINILLSIINGSPISLQTSAAVDEDEGGTLEDQLIPVHQLLFQGVADPPAYFFLFDTQGFQAQVSAIDLSSVDYSQQQAGVNNTLSRLLRGVLPSYGSSMQTGSPDDDCTDAPLPVQAGFCVVSGHQLGEDEDSENFRKAVSLIKASAACFGNFRHGLGSAVKLPHAAQGVPLYALITQAEKVIENSGEAPPMDEETGADQWETMLHDPRMVPVMQRLSRATGVQYARCRYTFGLNTLRPGNGTDIRELAALVALVDMVCEVVARDLTLREQQIVIRARDNAQQEVRPLGVPRAAGAAAAPSVPFMDVAQLKEFFRGSPRTVRAAPIAEAQEISGFEFIRMTDEEIGDVFDCVNNFGLCKFLQELVAPYRAAVLDEDE